MKRSMIKLLAVVMILVLPFQEALCEEITMYAICTDSYVNVREKPSTKAKVGGYLEFGWEVTVSDEAKDSSGTLWYKITDVNELGYGWVCANYLITDKPEKVDVSAKVKANGRVALYSRVNGKRKSWIKPGKKVKVKIKSASWCLTDKGWISTDYLEFEE